MIAALELLATLVAVKLWVPESSEKKASRIAFRGYTDNKSNNETMRSSHGAHGDCEELFAKTASY